MVVSTDIISFLEESIPHIGERTPLLFKYTFVVSSCSAARIAAGVFSRIFINNHQGHATEPPVWIPVVVETLPTYAQKL
jgi:hypothetical protein